MENVLKELNNYLQNKNISKSDKFDSLFILICKLIDNLGNSKLENINSILAMLDEFDFEANKKVGII